MRSRVVLMIMNVALPVSLSFILGLGLGLGLGLVACKKEPSPSISSNGERIRNPQVLNLGEAQSGVGGSAKSEMESASKNGRNADNDGNDTASRTSVDGVNHPVNGELKSSSPNGRRGGDSVDQLLGKNSDSSSKHGSNNDSKLDGSKSEYKVLILGDSLAATGFGVILEKRLDVHPQIRCVRKAKSASGLARPDFFDWISESKRQVRLQSPDLVVVIIGGNDGQDLLEKRGRNRRVGWKSQDWDENYQERIGQLLQPAVDAGAKILWLGLPRTDTKNFEAKLEIIRQSQREVIDKMGDIATYLDTTPLISGADGSLLKTIKRGKRKRKLRVDDGIHFTMAGSQYFADKVYPEVVKILGLELSP